MEDNTALWGTIPVPDAGEPHKVLNEQEMEVAMNAMETEPHEPEVEDEKKNLEAKCDTLKLVPAECSQMNPVILNAIELIQYAKHISDLTDRINTENKDLTVEIQNLSPIPPLLGTKSKHLDRPPDDESDFVAGKGSLPFSLNSLTRNQILYKSVATLAAHRGYDFSSSEALEVITSVTSDLITKICRMFRLTVDRNGSSPSLNYLHCLERVFHEMNLGTLRSYNYYYQTQVLDYQKSKRFQCEKLLEELHMANEAVITNLLKQEHIGNGQNYEMDFKQDDDDIPLLHFPASEDGTENDGFQSSLEHGFQMLHNLEQEQLQLGNIDGDKDPNLIIHHQSSTKYIKRQ